MRRLATAVAALLALSHAIACSRSEEQPRLCVTGGSLVDPDLETIEPFDLVVESGTIRRIPAGSCQGRTLDAHGAFIVPGFVDVHVHGRQNRSPTDAHQPLGRERAAQESLRAGVMALLDLEEKPDELYLARERLRGSKDHAFLFAGARVRVWPGDDTSPQAVKTRLERLIRHRQPDFIKIIPRGGDIAPFIGTARDLGFETVVHIETWEEAEQAVEAGASAITHFEDERVIPQDLVAHIHTQNTVVIPTMAVQCDLASIVDDPGLLEDSLLVSLTADSLRASYREPTKFTKEASEWLAWQQAGCVTHDFVSLQRLRDSKVRILAGSDAGNWGTFHGFSLHRELELMVEAGLSEWHALRAGTVDGARFLRLPWGVADGAPANFVVLDGSPITDISNTRRIRHIVFRGRLIDVTGR